MSVKFADRDNVFRNGVATEEAQSGEEPVEASGEKRGEGEGTEPHAALKEEHTFELEAGHMYNNFENDGDADNTELAGATSFDTDGELAASLWMLDRKPAAATDAGNTEVAPASGTDKQPSNRTLTTGDVLKHSRAFGDVLEMPNGDKLVFGKKDADTGYNWAMISNGRYLKFGRGIIQQTDPPTYARDIFDGKNLVAHTSEKEGTFTMTFPKSKDRIVFDKEGIISVERNGKVETVRQLNPPKPSAMSTDLIKDEQSKDETDKGTSTLEDWIIKKYKDAKEREEQGKKDLVESTSKAMRTGHLEGIQKSLTAAYDAFKGDGIKFRDAALELAAKMKDGGFTVRVGWNKLAIHREGSPYGVEFTIDGALPFELERKETRVSIQVYDWITKKDVDAKANNVIKSFIAIKKQ